MFACETCSLSGTITARGGAVLRMSAVTFNGLSLLESSTAIISNNSFSAVEISADTGSTLRISGGTGTPVAISNGSFGLVGEPNTCRVIAGSTGVCQ